MIPGAMLRGERSRREGGLEPAASNGRHTPQRLYGQRPNL